MTFDANRDLRIEASQGDEGTFRLRTRGLSARKRPEFVLARVDERALHGAAGVLNLLANHAVNEAEVRADQDVGVVLATATDPRELLLVVHTKLAVAPKRGRFGALFGGGDAGILELVDIDGSLGAPMAVATMLVHRAATRLANGDAEGAREELSHAIAICPGRVEVPPPGIEGRGTFNWQNHCAYFDLAKLTDEHERASSLFCDAVARAGHVTGQALADLAKLEASAMASEAARLLGLLAPSSSA